MTDQKVTIATVLIKNHFVNFENIFYDAIKPLKSDIPKLCTLLIFGP
jgi:hypothetical protein